MRALALLLLLPAAARAADSAADARRRVWRTVSSQTSPEKLRELRSQRRFASARRPDRLKTLIATLAPEKKRAAARELKALQGELKDAESLQIVGQAVLALGDARSASEFAAAAIARDENNPKAHLLAAQALLKLGQKEDALTEAEETLKFSPLNVEAIAMVKLITRREPGLVRRTAASNPLPAFTAHGSLSESDVRKLNGSLLLLGETPTGRKVLLAVAPDARGVIDLEKLQNARVDVRKDVLRTVRGHAQVSEAQGRDAVRFTHIIQLTPETLRNPEKALAPLLGEKLDNVSFWRRFKNTFSSVLMNLSGTVNRALIAIDLGIPSRPEPGDSQVALDTKFRTRVFQGDFPATLTPNENYGDSNAQDVRQQNYFQMMAPNPIHRLYRWAQAKFTKDDVNRIDQNLYRQMTDSEVRRPTTQAQPYMNK